MSKDAWAGYAAATYEVFADTGTFILRPNAVSPDLNALLAACDANSAAFITAANPAAQRLDDAENDARTRALCARCTSLGYDVIPGRGGCPDWGWETSVLIPGISLTDALKLGTEFGQDAILFAVKNQGVRLLACAGQTHNNPETEDI